MKTDKAAYLHPHTDIFLRRKCIKLIHKLQQLFRRQTIKKVQRRIERTTPCSSLSPLLSFLYTSSKPKEYMRLLFFSARFSLTSSHSPLLPSPFLFLLLSDVVFVPLPAPPPPSPPPLLLLLLLFLLLCTKQLQISDRPPLLPPIARFLSLHTLPLRSSFTPMFPPAPAPSIASSIPPSSSC